MPGPTEDVLNTNKVHVVSANAVLTENAWWSRLSTWTRLVGLGARLLTWKNQEVDRVILEEKSDHSLFKIVQIGKAQFLRSVQSLIPLEIAS